MIECSIAQTLYLHVLAMLLKICIQKYARKTQKVNDAGRRRCKREANGPSLKLIMIHVQYCSCDVSARCACGGEPRTASTRPGFRPMVSAVPCDGSRTSSMWPSLYPGAQDNVMSVLRTQLLSLHVLHKLLV